MKQFIVGTLLLASVVFYGDMALLENWFWTVVGAFAVVGLYVWFIEICEKIGYAKGYSDAENAEVPE